MKVIKDFFKENKILLIVLVISFIVFQIPLPYYVSAPGGVININNRISLNSKEDINGTLNMLYVSEYNGTIGTILLSYIIPGWDIDKTSDKQIYDESIKEINKRDKILLSNSIQNATFSAYNYANKKISINSYEHTVLAITNDKNNLKVGDIILEINDVKMESFNQLKKVIKDTRIGDKIKLLIKRDNKEKVIYEKVRKEEGKKVIGAAIITNYNYDLDPEINIKFKSSESGSSGGLMMALSMYTVISGDDIVKNRNIAGTGTIDIEGNVGEIDGIKYKLMGANKNNVDIVLVPSENYKEAMKVKKDYDYDIDIVSVKTLDDAIKYLKKTN